MHPDSREGAPAPEPTRALRLALVLWNGNLGGAETLSASLVEHMRRLGAEVSMVFVGQPRLLAERLASAGVPHTSIGLARGRDVLRHPRAYAAAVGRCGPDGSLLIERGFMGAALRAGGYRPPIVAVEHGALLELPSMSASRRLLRRLNFLSGAWADDAEVAVSDFMFEHTCRYPHARVVRRIYNGIDPDRYLPGERAASADGGDLVVGFTGRLIEGKGTDHLIRALAQAARHTAVRLLIAGEGPQRASLASLARELGVESNVSFLGVVGDVPAFWRDCDVATMPSDAFVESFSMVTLEAMTCGKPLIATRNGAVPELMVDAVTGTLVDPGDVDALARALVYYAEHPALRRAHGEAARERALRCFHIDSCAQGYLDLFGALARRRP